MSNATITPITITGDDTVCVNTKTNYYISPTAGITYTWAVTSPNAVASTTPTAASIQWNGVGTYAVTVTGINSSAVTVETGTITV